MNPEKKICFITCVSDERVYQECLLYINQLDVPEGFVVSTLAIRDAPSMAAGYNEGLRRSDAKYKIYLHQDVFVIRKDFLLDLIGLFEKYPHVGLLGLCGAKTLPENGVWWESDDSFGQTIESSTRIMKPLVFSEVVDDYESVTTLDGLLLATQTDIPWRSDLFDGFHFYDVSQSFEFIKHGFEVGVMKQLSPYVLHHCGFKVDWAVSYYPYRDIFVKEYLSGAD